MQKQIWIHHRTLRTKSVLPLQRRSKTDRPTAPNIGCIFRRTHMTTDNSTSNLIPESQSYCRMPWPSHAIRAPSLSSCHQHVGKLCQHNAIGLLIPSTLLKCAAFGQLRLCRRSHDEGLSLRLPQYAAPFDDAHTSTMRCRTGWSDAGICAHMHGSRGTRPASAKKADPELAHGLKISQCMAGMRCSCPRTSGGHACCCTFPYKFGPGPGHQPGQRS